MEEARSRIVIALSQGEPEPKGELSVARAPERPFASWIGLISALEGALEVVPVSSNWAVVAEAICARVAP
jgi:hypothetical protein